MSDTEPVIAYVARSSADEWDNIIPYDRSQPGRGSARNETPFLPRVSKYSLRTEQPQKRQRPRKVDVSQRQSRQHVSSRFFANATLYRRI